MKLSNRFFLFLFSSFYFSCNSTREVKGTYVLQDNQQYSMHLVLNENGTFAEFVRGHNCEEFFYAGYFYKRRNKIILEQITQNLNHLSKSDTIMSFLNSFFKGKSITIIENQRNPSSDTRVFINGKDMGKTNEKGQLEILGQIQLYDSLRIEREVGDVRSYVVNFPGTFNQLFIFLYDYSFEPCSNFYFTDRLIKSANGLFFMRKGKGLEKKGRIYLKRIN